MCHPLTYTYKLATELLYLEPLTNVNLPMLHSLQTDEYVRKCLCDDPMLPISQPVQILETALDIFASKHYELWLIHLKRSLAKIGFAALYVLLVLQLLSVLLPQYIKKG